MIKQRSNKKTSSLTNAISRVYSTLNTILSSEVLVTTLASICSTLILYSLFYLFADKIWAMNLNVTLTDLTPTIRWAVTTGQRDGIEAYVLYLLAFADILGTFSIVKINDLINRKKKDEVTKLLNVTLLAFLVLSTILFTIAVGFTPPMFNPTPLLQHALIVIAIVTLGTLAIIKIARWKNNLANIIIIVSLIPVCFIATQPIAMSDYSYIFAPALRLINGVKISDIYCQYDLFLSMSSYHFSEHLVFS